MIATRHTRAGDKVPLRNLTRQRNCDKCTVLEGPSKTKAENIMGLEQDTASMLIEVNGYIEIVVEDVVEILGTRYVVMDTKENVDYDLAKKRKDVGSFTGSVLIALARGR